MRVVIGDELKPLLKQMNDELLLKRGNQSPSFQCARRAYNRGGRGSGASESTPAYLRFSFGLGTGNL